MLHVGKSNSAEATIAEAEESEIGTRPPHAILEQSGS
jgi:hypothetical protein